MTARAIRTPSARILAVATFSAWCFAFAAPASADVCCKCLSSADLKSNICITTAVANCSDLPGNSTNDAVRALNCSSDVLDVSSATCKPIAEGGICAQGPFDEKTYTPATTPPTQQAEPTVGSLSAPVLGVPIPGLTFTQSIAAEGPDFRIPWFAEYVAAGYRYLVGVAVIAAAVMIVYGGFKYILSSSGAGVQTGKEVIQDAIVGLLLVLGAFTILETVNPALTSFGPLKVTRVKPEIYEYMSGREDAQATMTEVGLEPGQAAGTTEPGQTPAPGQTPSTPYSGTFDAGKNHVIPDSCPGRDPSWLEPSQADRFQTIGKEKVMKRNYTISCKGRQLDQKVIDFYLEEQKRTGVPAAVIMAQMVTEAGACSVFNLADGGPSSIYYNYGGIGCRQKQVPEGTCAHVAFTKKAYELGSKTPHPLDCTVHNSRIDASCVSICESGNEGANQNCGPDCYPQPSHASTVKEGKEIWMPSIQCSRKFKTPQEFLDAHLGFVRFCLPYNDSVYKFAYCIGASTYAGVTGGKGMAI
ncbi:glucosaminidase domain-containing protein, partial [Candidatus Uhrbacteria bacterium]|nr:glucosaminidase domain-containing protein [Candidatus Uhrbacteria bacterium]